MEALHQAVAVFLREQRVSRAEPLLAAVSGGADSIALLEILVQLGQRVAAAHVHHELRGADADADLAFVVARSAELGVPMCSRRASDPGLAVRADTSPEARARALRYAALEQMRARGEYAHVLTAHTLDDQAETLLLRALRGTDLTGLAGIAPRLRSRNLLRPLLGVRRSELRAYLRRRALHWREDGSNTDLRVPRNLLRAEVLPLLERAHPGAVAHLAALADAARAWREPLERADRERLAAASREGDGGLWLDAARLAPLSAPECRRLLAALMRQAGLGERVTRSHLERIERFLHTARAGQSLSLPARRVLLRTPELFWLGLAPGPARDFSHELAPGRMLELPGCGLRLSLELGKRLGRGSTELPLHAPAPQRLIVRSPRALDVLAEAGGAERRLSDWLAAARWPRAIQKRLAVVEKEGRIVGIVGASARSSRAWSPPADGPAADSGWWIRAERLSCVSAS